MIIASCAKCHWWPHSSGKSSPRTELKEIGTLGQEGDPSPHLPWGKILSARAAEYGLSADVTKYNNVDTDMRKSIVQICAPLSRKRT